MAAWEKTKRAMDVMATMLVVLAASFVIWTEVDQRWLKPAPQALVQDVTDLTIPAARVRHSRGAGAVALIEFTDYQCPYCGRHARDTEPQIDATLVDRGAIRHVVLNFPLTRIHQNAEKAGEAAECAGRQGKFWEMHARLFGNQEALGEDDLLRSADAIALDRPQFTRCLAEDAAAEVKADIAEGSRLGVNSTPTFFLGTFERDGSIRLGKRINGAAPFQQFADLIEAVHPSTIARQ
jgi:protein-disulfide isomerase